MAMIFIILKVAFVIVAIFELNLSETMRHSILKFTFVKLSLYEISPETMALAIPVIALIESSILPDFYARTIRLAILVDQTPKVRCLVKTPIIVP